MKNKNILLHFLAVIGDPVSSDKISIREGRFANQKKIERTKSLFGTFSKRF